MFCGVGIFNMLWRKYHQRKLARKKARERHLGNALVKILSFSLKSQGATK
jgi:hypothetical protein